jgi:hypothetical protein
MNSARSPMRRLANQLPAFVGFALLWAGLFVLYGVVLFVSRDPQGGREVAGMYFIALSVVTGLTAAALAWVARAVEQAASRVLAVVLVLGLWLVGAVLLWRLLWRVLPVLYPD